MGGDHQAAEARHRRQRREDDCIHCAR
jgi:hypothetical protein